MSRKQFNGIFDEMNFATVSVNPASMLTTADSSVAVTVAGASVGDLVLCAPAIDMQEVSYSAYVSAANTVEIVFYNAAAGTIDLAASNWNIFTMTPNVSAFSGN